MTLFAGLEVTPPALVSWSLRGLWRVVRGGRGAVRVTDKGEDLGVVRDAVDYGRGDGVVRGCFAQSLKGRLEVTMIEPIS